MSTWDWIITLFIAYWVVVLLWIKGTDPLASGIWHVIWAVLRIPLFVCGGFVVFALVCGSGRR